jgi:antitoxin component YwqK of YwqJK toxin-antitoxin module
MRYIIILLFSIIISTYKAQSDTIRKIYKEGLLSEVIFYKNNKEDVKIIFIYKEGILTRREWWKNGINIATVIE